MKQILLMCAGFCLALSFTACGSSESAYKKAYEKAQSQAAQQQVATEVPVVTPVETVLAGQTALVDNFDNVTVRQERVSMVDGNGLKNYSVVVGSFSVIANAEGLQKRLKNAGCDAQIVKNEERNMYRVIATTFDSKSEAAQSRDLLRATYPDAWLLFATR